MAEIEIFRLTPKLYHYYEFALCTKKVGIYPNERYYTINKPMYVGEFIKVNVVVVATAAGAEIFNNDGEINIIVLDYEGLSCFRNVTCGITRNN